MNLSLDCGIRAVLRIPLRALPGAALCLLATIPAAAAPTKEPPAPVARNLILISVDTLRADRLGVYGYGRDTSPAIDALARRGAWFTEAISQASWTLPSHMTILTGLYPSAHGTVGYDRKLPEGVPTLAEALNKKGFHTAGFVQGGYLNERFGYARGFESWTPYYQGFDGMLEKAESFIEGIPAEGRYFLFLHTYDVHCPYNPAPEYRAKFADAPGKPPIDTTGLCGKRDLDKLPLTPGQLA